MLYCDVVYAPSFNPPAEAKNAFKMEKQRQGKKENMQWIIKQQKRHEVLCKESQYIEPTYPIHCICHVQQNMNISWQHRRHNIIT